jgi:hypothetical protein
MGSIILTFLFSPVYIDGIYNLRTSSDMEREEQNKTRQDKNCQLEIEKFLA